MKHHAGRLALLAAAIAAMTLIGVATAAPPDGTPDKSRHERVVEYWTPDRVAHAIPRAFALDPSSGTVVPLKKPGGGGGKPGGGSAVTGAPWTGAGLIKATTGKVLFTMAGVNYVCSGAVAQDSNTTTSLVLTAGHCAYDESGLAFATNWMFVPDYEDGGTFSCATTRYGCWTAIALVTTTAWATGGASLSGFNDDYAFAVVGAGGRTTSEAVQLDATVGSQAIAFNVTHPTSVTAFGYPHASPYDGQSLIYCAGTDVADTWGGSTDFGLNCDMTGGSSGGPWLVGFDPATGVGQLNSVNSFKYTRGRLANHMFGPYFDGYTSKTYIAAQTATTNTTVAP